MKKGIVVSVSCLVMMVAVLATSPRAAATYGRAHIWIPEKGESLWDEQMICVETVKEPYIAPLKKENPDLDEKELAKHILVEADEEKGTLVITVPAEDEKSALENAARIGRIAVQELVRRSLSRQREALEEIREEQDRTMHEIRAMEEDLLNLQRKKGIFDPQKGMESLVSRLSAYQDGLVEAKMKRAELQVKLELLSKKAVEVRDTVSVEQIASLQKAEHDLRMQLEDKNTEGVFLIQKCEMILKQKQDAYERTEDLHEKALISKADIEKARFELEMARHDYDQAKESGAELGRRLERVREEIALARQKLAETGGLALAEIIAEKALECETELAATEVRTRQLRNQVQDVQAQIADSGAAVSELRRRQLEIDALKKQVSGLLESETSVRAQLRGGLQPQVVSVESVERPDEGRPVAYSVIGDVRNPGSYVGLERTTLLGAIARAGGFTDYADRDEVVVVRETDKGSERHTLDIAAILSGKAPDDFVLKPRDIVWVSRKGPVGP
jgi:hypothetical protein